LADGQGKYGHGYLQAGCIFTFLPTVAAARRDGRDVGGSLRDFRLFHVILIFVVERLLLLKVKMKGLVAPSFGVSSSSEISSKNFPSDHPSIIISNCATRARWTGSDTDSCKEVQLSTGGATL